MLGLSPELLLVAALFILGPERLPGAIATVRTTAQRAKEALANAHEQISTEIGPGFEQLRKPLGELTQLRTLDPRTALTRFAPEPSAAEPPTPAPPPAGRVSGVDMEATFAGEGGRQASPTGSSGR